MREEFKLTQMLLHLVHQPHVCVGHERRPPQAAALGVRN